MKLSHLHESPLVDLTVSDENPISGKRGHAALKAYERSGKLEQAFRKSHHNWHIVSMNTRPGQIPKDVIKKDAINLVLSFAPDDQHPLTPWMIAHQVGEALGGDRSLIAALLMIIKHKLGYEYKNEFPGRPDKEWDQHDPYLQYDRDIIKIIQTMGTMKSVRDNNLGDAGEFVHELFAQYVITGKITFQNDWKKYESYIGNVVKKRLDQFIGKVLHLHPSNF